MTSLANDHDHDHKLNLLMNFERAEIHFSILVIVAAVNIPEIIWENAAELTVRDRFGYIKPTVVGMDPLSRLWKV